MGNELGSKEGVLFIENHANQRVCQRKGAHSLLDVVTFRASYGLYCISWLLGLIFGSHFPVFDCVLEGCYWICVGNCIPVLSCAHIELFLGLIWSLSGIVGTACCFDYSRVLHRVVFRDFIRAV